MLKIFLSLGLFFSNSSKASPLQVMIDPGHGGVDNGAVYGETREADIALKVGLELKKLLERDQEFKASLTRTTDSALTLEERVKKAEANKADLFVSLHANASKDPRAKGVEFYFQNNLAPDEESLYLANLENQIYQKEQSKPESENANDITKKSDVLAIIEDLKRNTKMRESHQLTKNLLQAWSPDQINGSRVIRQAPFYVISRTRIPSVLIELGFMSHAKEVNQLKQVGYQKQLAQRIYNGLKDYKEKVDKAELRSLH